MFTTYTEVQGERGKQLEARQACEEQLTAARRFRGCIAIDLFVDAATPDRFVFIASWETRELWQQHIDSAEQKRSLAISAKGRVGGS